MLTLFERQRARRIHRLSGAQIHPARFKNDEIRRLRCRTAQGQQG
jgi:hypothetical protein